MDKNTMEVVMYSVNGVLVPDFLAKREIVEIPDEGKKLLDLMFVNIKEWDADKILKMAHTYQKNKVKYITVSALDDMVLISLIFDMADNKKQLKQDEGYLFTYTFNYPVDYFSELGDIAFQRINGKLFRF